MKTSKRNRNKGRTIETYNNKLNKITLYYNKLFYQSKNSKQIFDNLSEIDQKTIEYHHSQSHKKGVKKVPNPFFCDKYPTLQKFLEVNKLRKVSSKWKYY